MASFAKIGLNNKVIEVLSVVNEVLHDSNGVEQESIGIAHVAYIPHEKVVGLSKLARVVEAYSRRLQTQERLTMEIANTIFKGLKAQGAAVSINAVHHCMTSRGIKKHEATTVTNYFTGMFKESHNLQNRFLQYIGQK